MKSFEKVFIVDEMSLVEHAEVCMIILAPSYGHSMLVYVGNDKKYLICNGNCNLIRNRIMKNIDMAEEYNRNNLKRIISKPTLSSF